MSNMSISNNNAANASNYYIRRASDSSAASAARLSSGKRVIRPSDDVAGLSAGTSLMAKIASLRSSLTNATQGSSMMQVAEGGIGQIIDILSEQKALAVQAQSGSLTSTERSYLNQQFQTLTDEINQIASTTNFGGVNLLSGGLGTTTRLANTSALAAAFTPATANGSAGAATASTVAIQGFNTSTGASQAGFATVGQINITDAGGTTLANAAYDAVDTSLHGKFSSFRFTDVNYGVSATLTATINGVEYSGTVTNAATNATLNNGNTYIKIGTGAMTLTNAGTVSATESAISAGFANTSIMRTSQVQGVDFSSTRLTGAAGIAATGISMLRTAGDPSDVSIGNFRYVGSAGADANVIAVDVNGKTFTATGVQDSVDAAAATRYSFESGDGEALTLDITGLTTAISNIRTSTTDRAGFIDALNIGFSRAGGGLQFNLGDSSNQMAISLGSASSAALYGNQTLDIATTGTAATTESALDTAIANATAIQAKIGAYQESFDYSAASLESSILGQDEARGNYLDTDVAAESTNYASSQVQVQAGVAVLAQANQMPSTFLTLLQKQ